MDVKALYPSMEWKEIFTSVKEMIEDSHGKVENVYFNEVGKYLAFIISKEGIIKERLQNVIPKRK